MKNRILLISTIILIVSGTSIFAQEKAGKGEGLNFEKRIGVEISDEAAVVIDGKKITLSEAIKRAIETEPGYLHIKV